jgi:tetratricopeptide (TPR) repeat protein
MKKPPHPTGPREANPPRLARAAGLVAFGLACTAAAFTPDPHWLPYPSTASQDSWYGYQRHRYMVTPLLRRADRLLAADRLDEAREVLERIHRIMPAQGQAQAILLQVYERTGQAAEAEALAGELLETHPDYLPARLVQGRLALRRGESAAARAALQPVANSSHPLRIQAWPDLARACLQQGDAAAAESVIRAWRQQADGLDARMAEAECAVRLEKWRDALESLRQAERFATERQARGQIRLQQGYLLTRLNDLDGAGRAFREARDLLAGRAYLAEIDRVLGQNAFRAGRFDEAARHFQTSLLESFDEDVGLSYLASLQQIGEWERAAWEARAMLKRTDLTESGRRSLRQRQLAIHRNLPDATGLYEAAKAMYLETGETDYLLEMLQIAERVKKVDEVSVLFEGHMARHGPAAGADADSKPAKRKKKMEETEAPPVPDVPAGKADAAPTP